MASTKKKDVPKCIAAITIKTKAEVNDVVSDGKTVFSIAKGPSSRTYYKRCTKSRHEDSKEFCKVHHDGSLHGNVMTFEEVMKNDTALQVSSDKLLETKSKSNDDPEPIIILKITPELKKMFENLIEKKNEKIEKKSDKK